MAQLVDAFALEAKFCGFDSLFADIDATVVELVYTGGLNPPAERHTGSIPVGSTS